MTDNRGISADGFFLDEAAFIPEAMLQALFAPMLKVSGTTMVIISTLNGAKSWFTKLFDRTDEDAENMFLRIKIELTCDGCKKKIKSGEEGVECHHMDHLNPPWLRSTNADRVKIFTMGNERMYQQDVMGVVWENRDRCFDEQWLDNLQARALWDASDLERLPHVFTFIDPAGGGDSQTAFVSIVRTPEEECTEEDSHSDVTIVGLADTDAVSLEDIMRQLKAYIKNLKQTDELSHLQHYIAVENNYGGGPYAGLFVKTVQSLLPEAIEFTTNTNKSGCVTTYERKRQAVMDTAMDLYRGSIHFAECLVTLDGTVGGQERIKEKFMKQMSNMHKKKTASNRITFAGKTKEGGQDDMAIAFMLGSHYSLDIQTLIQDTDDCF